MRSIQIHEAPRPGAVIDVQTATPPTAGEVIELKRGKETVAIAVVEENPNTHTYQAIVII